MRLPYPHANKAVSKQRARLSEVLIQINNMPESRLNLKRVLHLVLRLTPERKKPGICVRRRAFRLSGLASSIASEIANHSACRVPSCLDRPSTSRNRRPWSSPIMARWEPVRSAIAARRPVLRGPHRLTVVPRARLAESAQTGDRRLALSKRHAVAAVPRVAEPHRRRTICMGRHGPSYERRMRWRGRRGAVDAWVFLRVVSISTRRMRCSPANRSGHSILDPALPAASYAGMKRAAPRRRRS